MSSFSFIVRVECTVFLTFPRSVDAFRYRRLHIARALRIHHAHMMGLRRLCPGVITIPRRIEYPTKQNNNSVGGFA